jgi:hypothetical protein
MDQLPHPIESPIDICRRGQVVTRAVVERWAMPDGRCGAKWGGLVFPLLDGGRIETTDTATPPAMCRPWVDPRPSWRFEPGATGADAYVFLDGDGATLERALHDLAAAGLVVHRSGPNLAGSSGDWFIRLAFPGPNTEALLARTLGEMSSPLSNGDTGGLRERLLTEALEAAAAARERLCADLDDAVARAAAAAHSTAELSNLRTGLEEMAARVAAAESEAERLRTATPPRLPSGTIRLERELAVAASAMLSRLELIGGSMAFVAIELSDRAAIWRILGGLDRQERGQPAGWKPVAGRAGWWERHFPTGQDDQGRVYAKLNPDRNGWRVLVSHKQAQAGDLRRLD